MIEFYFAIANTMFANNPSSLYRNDQGIYVRSWDLKRFGWYGFSLCSSSNETLGTLDLSGSKCEKFAICKAYAENSNVIDLMRAGLVGDNISSFPVFITEMTWITIEKDNFIP